MLTSQKDILGETENMASGFLQVALANPAKTGTDL